ncbi:hypothetical protein ABIB35_002876 [Arthrobacter sp. UYP6]
MLNRSETEAIQRVFAIAASHPPEVLEIGLFASGQLNSNDLVPVSQTKKRDNNKYCSEHR